MGFLEDVKRHAGFDEHDAEVLRALRPLLAGHAAGIAEHFYASLLAHPGARGAITGGAEQVDRLQRTLVLWMHSGLEGPHDAAFYERRARIGRRHVEIGLPQSYMITAVGVIRQDYRAVLTGALGHEIARYVRALLAVDRLLDVELAILLETYREASDARLLAHERDAALHQRARLTERLATVSTLSAGFAHELRNPVNNADLQLQLLERRMAHLADLAAPLRDPVALAREELGRLARLVTDFLAFARPRPPQRATIDVGTLLRRGVARLGERGRARGIDVRLRLPPVAVIARLDVEQLEQLVRELLENAIDAAHAEVELELTLGDGTARLMFRDDGPGIAPADRTRVFEPFFTEKPGGTGLGLSIVHSIVDAHGGTIAVGGDGCTEIVVELPVG